MTLDEIKAKYDSFNQPHGDSYLAAIERGAAEDGFIRRVFPYLLDIAITARRDLNARLGPGRDLQQEVPTLIDVQRAVSAIEAATL